ncbi:MAG: hypothetical protein JWP44_5095 [Mucilaginibacter sp.]|nr:hypothetical protein [Mucilaginibacter sp.]
MKSITLNTVRFITSDDVYHYTVDNRPLQDLESNDEILKVQLQRQSPLTTGDVGDANITTGASGKTTVFYNSPLTVDRAVTLNTTNPQDGDLVRVVRTAGATGSSSLHVQGGGATPKVIAAGQWVDYEFWGNGLGIWMETGFGSL